MSDSIYEGPVELEPDDESALVQVPRERGFLVVPVEFIEEWRLSTIHRAVKTAVWMFPAAPEFQWVIDRPSEWDEVQTSMVRKAMIHDGLSEQVVDWLLR